ncbi:MAG: ATP-binding protein [Alkalispirochaeta sp.]
MSLFQRFFLIATLVLVFQSLLTALLVSGRVREQDDQLALTELDDESQRIYENFNSWKRVLWEQLVTLPEDPTTDEFRARLAARRTVDWLVLSNGEGRPEDAFNISGVPFFEELHGSWDTPPRPVIALQQRGNTVVIIASTPAPSSRDGVSSIHLVKLLDDTFCRQLAIGSAATATFMTAAGVLPDLPEVPRSESFVKTVSSQRGYLRIPGLRNDRGERFNGSVRNIGTILSNTEYMTLHLAVVLNASWQDHRLQTIGRNLVLASLISIGLSAGLVLLGSWTLTKPVMHLSRAMDRVAGGDLSVRLAESGGQETRTLFQGFNRMAGQLEVDVAERERHIEEITALTHTNETIFQSIGSGMITLDWQLNVVRVNHSAAELLGASEAELVDCSVTEVGTPELGEHFTGIARQVQQNGSPVVGNARRINHHLYEVSGFPLRGIVTESRPVIEGCLVIVDDVTERVSLEERMARAEKLSSLAILTAGVAHEINNPLSSITTNVQNIASEIDDPEQKRAIGYIQQETRRIRYIVGRLLKFSGNRSESHAWADLNDEVELVLATVQFAFPQSGTLHFEKHLTEELPAARIPGDEVRQILLNLITNAVHAIGEAGGTVRVTTTSEEDVLALEVTDDGAGIPEELRQRIFDPFFTTKAEGSGLGLSVVYGLLSRRGGSCAISSVHGEGTTVRLTIPKWRDTP